MWVLCVCHRTNSHWWIIFRPVPKPWVTERYCLPTQDAGVENVVALSVGGGQSLEDSMGGLFSDKHRLICIISFLQSQALGVLRCSPFYCYKISNFIYQFINFFLFLSLFFLSFFLFS